MAIAAAPYIHSKPPQIDLTTQHNQNITGVRFWTEAEWLASRTAQGSNPNIITIEASDAVAIDEQED